MSRLVSPALPDPFGRCPEQHRCWQQIEPISNPEVSIDPAPFEKREFARDSFRRHERRVLIEP